MPQIQLHPELEPRLAAEVEAKLAFRHEFRPRLDGLKLRDRIHEGHRC